MAPGNNGRTFNVQGHGTRGYGPWMSSADWALMLTQSERFPAALAQLHSAYLHSMGVTAAVRLVEETLRRAVLVGGEAFTVSRIDPYADVQGWPRGKPQRRTILSSKLAGMDGNRTHLGRLCTAPQTVLKTAGGTSPRTSPRC
jgi:hypothetical protein